MMRIPAFVAASALVLVLLLAVLPVSAEGGTEPHEVVDLDTLDPLGPNRDAVERSIRYLLDHQNGDGCLQTEWGTTAAATAWSAIVLRAAGKDPSDGEPSLLDGLAACAPPPGGDGEHASLNHVAALSRHILALVAARQDPHGFAGRDWIDELRSYHNGLGFQDPDHPTALNDDAFAIMALVAAGVPTADAQVSSSAGHLRLGQNADGGWGIDMGGRSNTDATAAAVQALLRAERIHRDHPAARNASTYLQERHDGDTGCFKGSADHAPNPDSTAWAVMALLALHVDPRAPAQQADAWRCLMQRQMDDGGFAPGMSATTSSLATTMQATLALTAHPFWTARDDLQTPSAQITVQGAPLAGEPVRLVTNSTGNVSWRAPDGTFHQGPGLMWVPPAPGGHTFELLLFGETGPSRIAQWMLVVDGAENATEGEGPTGPGADPTDEKPSTDGDTREPVPDTEATPMQGPDLADSKTAAGPSFPLVLLLLLLAFNSRHRFASPASCRSRDHETGPSASRRYSAPPGGRGPSAEAERAPGIVHPGAS